MTAMKWLILFVLPVFVCWGCAAGQKGSSTNGYPLLPIRQPVNEYYYYMEAHFHKERNKPDKAIAFVQRALDLDAGSFFLKKELAFLHMDMEEFDKAANIMKRAIARDPGNIEAIIMLGSIRQEMNQEGEAILLYERALDMTPERENLYLVLGSLYMAREAFEDAARVYRKLVQVYGDSYAGRFFLARSLTALGAYREAEKELYETLALRPDLLEPRFELLDLYINKPSEFEAADIDARIVTLYNEILAEQPQNTRASIELGLFRLEHNNEAEAEAARHLAELGRRNDADQEIARFIARNYIENDKHRQAIALIEGMLKGAADTSYLHYLCGFSYDHLDEKGKALEHFKQVAAESRFHRESTFRIAYIHHEHGQSAESIAYLNELIAKDPANTDLLLYLAIIHEEMELYDEAEDILKKAIGLSPDSSHLHFRLGVVYDKQEKKEKCIEQMKIAVQLNPDDPNALNYLGYTYAELGIRLDEAETLIVRALAIKPNDGYITDSLGWVYFQKGQYERALEILQRAVSIVDDDPVILEHLGDAYRKTGFLRKAVEYYERALNAGARNREEIKGKIEQLMNRGT